MKTRIIEATQQLEGPSLNWGKFLIGQFDTEWEIGSVIGQHRSILGARGWGPKEHRLVLDLETGEGSILRMGGHAPNDLRKHQLWVCPLYPHLLEALYRLWPWELDDLPAVIELPHATGALYRERDPGPEGLRQQPGPVDPSTDRQPEEPHG